jgi:hypothetical protein
LECRVEVGELPLGREEVPAILSIEHLKGGSSKAQWIEGGRRNFLSAERKSQQFSQSSI